MRREHLHAFPHDLLRMWNGAVRRTWRTDKCQSQSAWAHLEGWLGFGRADNRRECDQGQKWRDEVNLVAAVTLLRAGLVISSCLVGLVRGVTLIVPIKM